MNRNNVDQERSRQKAKRQSGRGPGIIRSFLPPLYPAELVSRLANISSSCAIFAGGSKPCSMPVVLAFKSKACAPMTMAMVRARHRLVRTANGVAVLTGAVGASLSGLNPRGRSPADHPYPVGRHQPWCDGLGSAGQTAGGTGALRHNRRGFLATTAEVTATAVQVQPSPKHADNLIWPLNTTIPYGPLATPKSSLQPI
jgi:hypothetical protein